MKINGHRTHLGVRERRAGGQVREVGPIAPRQSVEVDLEVVWYPHRDAPSVLPPNLFTASHTTYTQERGIVLRPQRRPAWSWLG